MELNNLQTLVLEEEGHVWRMALNRPDKLNALNARMYSEIGQVLDAAEADPGCRVLVVTGTGKAFCAGGDIAELSRAAAGLASVQARLCMSHRLALRFRSLKQPVIMAVNGAAVGAGLSLMLNGDVVLASPKAKFGAGFLKVGLMPDMGGIHNLVRRLGSAKACELTFMGELFGAEAAARMGLVNKVVEPELLLTEAADWAAKMAEMPFITLGILKKAIYKAQEIHFQDEVEDEINLQSLCLLSEDGREGLKAFLEKRAPKFNR